MNNDLTKLKAVGFFRCYFLVMCYVLMTVVTTNLFMAKWGLRGEAGGKSYQALVSYEGDRPYVYRMLVPALTGAIADILMQVLPDNVKRVFRENPPLKRYIRVPDEQWDQRISVSYHITYALMLSFLFLTLLILRQLSHRVFDAPNVVHDFMPLLFLLLLPFTFQKGGYYYDFLEFLMIPALLLLMINRRFIFYYFLFVLAILNKESNVLVGGYFLTYLFFKKQKIKILAMHGLLHVVIGGAVLFYLRMRFAENPGVPLEDHLMSNIKFWLDYKTYFLLNNAYAPFPLLPKPQHILIFPIFLFFLFYSWKEKPTILKFLAGPMFCVLTVLFLSKGFKDEIRVYSLMFPLFYLLSFNTFCRLNSIALKNRDL